jgi:CRISPR-associated protein Cmr1
MRQVTFTLRTLTPLFLAGADQTSAELRAPTFRGLMRYWSRALVGGIVGTEANGLKQVIEAESALFGTTDTASMVSLRVSRPSHEPKEFTEQISRKDAAGKWQATGKGYLFWSMARSGNVNKGNLKPARWYFPPGTQFQVTLATHGEQTDQLQQAVAVFWMLTQLGSLGSRARRCAGSLAVQEIAHDTISIEQFAFTPPATAQELLQQLEKGIRAARNLCAPKAQLAQMQQSNFDVLARGRCRIWILQDHQPWSSAEAAVTRLGEQLQSYRSQIDIYRRRIFGLPLPPKFFKDRRSSPLLLRITQLQGNRYVALAVLFKTGGKNICIEDYGIIERWITGFAGRLEVTL